MSKCQGSLSSQCFSQIPPPSPAPLPYQSLSLGAQGRGHPPGGESPPSPAQVGSPLLLPGSCQQTAREPWEVRSNADDAGARAKGRRGVHQGGD